MCLYVYAYFLVRNIEISFQYSSENELQTIEIKENISMFQTISNAH